MEIIVGLVVVIILLLCLGVQFGTIMFWFLLFISGLMALTELFFIYSVTRMLLAKKRSAVFSRIDRREGAKFDTAFYSIDGEEYPNIFPCEVVMRDKFYKTDKEVTVRFDEKKKRVFDRNAVLTCSAGVVLCAVLPVLMTVFFLR